MLKIYRSQDDGLLQEENEITSGCWVHLIAPGQEEIHLVTSKLGIPFENIKDSLDEEERSRIELDEDHVLIIVDTPVLSEDENQSPIFDTLPLGIIITDECFVTVCLKENPIVTHFLKNKVKHFSTYKKTRFVLQILYLVSTYFLKYLKQINKMTNDIEKELHQSMKNKELFSLLNLEKSLVYFTTSLKSNHVVLQKILKGNYLKLYAGDQDLLEDVIVENQQAISMAETYSTILSGMMDAFASVISNNLTMVMKFLTSITIILSLPTMVASFYGMNVPVPFQEYPHSFFVAIIISACLSSVTALIFWKRKYF